MTMCNAKPSYIGTPAVSCTDLPNLLKCYLYISVLMVFTELYELFALRGLPQDALLQGLHTYFEASTRLVIAVHLRRNILHLPFAYGIDE